MAARNDRGPLLSSLVLVGLATVATGLLVLVGVRGSIPTLPSGNTDGGPRAPGDVVVNDRPAPSRSPSPRPSPTPDRPRVRPTDVTPPRSRTATVAPRPATSAATPRATSSARPTSASLTARPQPSSPAPAPSPSCQERDRTGRCRKTASPAP